VSYPWKSIKEAAISHALLPGKKDLFMSKATVMSIKRDNTAYAAGPAPNCLKKVIATCSLHFNLNKFIKVLIFVL